MLVKSRVVGCILPAKRQRELVGTAVKSGAALSLDFNVASQVFTVCRASTITYQTPMAANRC